MGPILLGLLALIVIVALLRAFAAADPKVLKKLLRYLAIAALGCLAIFLAVIERWAGAVFIGGIAWSLYTGGHAWPGGWPHYHFPGGGGSRPGRDQTTTVRSQWVEMELDHDSGEMRGTILKGADAGRSLDSLERKALLAFYLQAGGGDAETARILEAYLDRKLGVEWRDEVRRGAAPKRGDAAMTRDEALKVLGLEAGAGEDEIRAAHRRLMMQNHPDKGGSDYLASKINEAKDVLLGQ